MFKSSGTWFSVALNAGTALIAFSALSGVALSIAMLWLRLWGLA